MVDYCIVFYPAPDPPLFYLDYLFLIRSTFDPTKTDAPSNRIAVLTPAPSPPILEMLRCSCPRCASNNILSAGNWQHSCMFLPAAGPCCKCFTSQSPYPVTHLNQRLPLPAASASTCILLSAAHILLFCLASRSRFIAPDLVRAVSAGQNASTILL